MQAIFNRKFLKDLSQIPENPRLDIEELVFKHIPECANASQIKNLKKLKGFKEYYRIRFGDYRIGLKINNTEISFERVLHRKDIYKLFP